MFGEVIPGSDRATLLDSRLILMWGNNPAENRMGRTLSISSRKRATGGPRLF
jgi:anaerobic selenocysteine-containing dehydrogenase